jgi:uncharacterized protein
MSEYLTPGVYIEEIATSRSIEGVSTNVAAFIGTAGGGSLHVPVLVTSRLEFIREFGDGTLLASAVAGFFANGGMRCFIVRVPAGGVDAAFIGTDGGSGQRTGMQVLREIPEASIVAIPGIASVPVQQALLVLCAELDTCFAILDPPRGATVQEVRGHRVKLSSRVGFGALYFPWLMVQPSGTLPPVSVPPSGHVAGIYARNDILRGVHKAPANEIVEGIAGLSLSVEKGEQDLLNPEGINVIRHLPGRGIRVWGARTLATDPEFRYVNVRRLFIYMEESIRRGTEWAVFEQNGPPLWGRVAQAAESFLFNIWRDGTLMGTKPDEAYFVKCDRTTMTQDDLDAGRLICLIGVAPVKPAEFVIFRIGQKTGAASP